MSVDAMLPCFTCGKALKTVCAEEDNQPYGGTEFRAYGHYGSTFWDSFDGEELVLNVCDACLRSHQDRLAQHKRFLPAVSGRGLVGRSWVDRPMVAYSGSADAGHIRVDEEEVGVDSRIEWDAQPTSE